MDRFVTVGILVEHGCALLVLRARTRSFYPGVWDIPGGHGELGEAPEQALVRELAEELGITVLAYEPIPVDHITVESIPLYSFHVTEWSGTPENRQPHEHDELRWIPIAEVETLDLASEIIPVLLRAIDL